MKKPWDSATSFLGRALKGLIARKNDKNWIVNIPLESFLHKILTVFFLLSSTDAYCRIFTFFYAHKKKVLDSRKFSTSSLRWIDMLWNVLNTIWPFLENVCLAGWLSACLSVLFFGNCISRTNGRKLMKLNIQLHLYGT